MFSVLAVFFWGGINHKPHYKFCPYIMNNYLAEQLLTIALELYCNLHCTLKGVMVISFNRCLLKNTKCKYITYSSIHLGRFLILCYV